VPLDVRIVILLSLPVIVPNSGIVTWFSARISSSKASNSSSERSISSIKNKLSFSEVKALSIGLLIK
jgi:hypothetical protein